MTDTTQRVSIDKPDGILRAAGANMGFIHLGKMQQLTRPTGCLLLVPAGSDAAEDFVAALRQAAATICTWELGAFDRISRRRRLREFARMRASMKAAANPLWVGVAPYSKRTAEESAHVFAGVPRIILTDDLAALWLGGEADAPDSLTALIRAADSLLDLVTDLAGSNQRTLVVSARKAKEFAREILLEVFALLGAEVSNDSLAAAASVLARQQSVATRVNAPRLRYEPVFKWGLDSVFKRGVVAGWVRKAMSDEKVVVRVMMDGVEIARDSAGYFRQTLLDIGVGDGSHAFAIDISSHLGAQPKRVEIRTVDGNVLVGIALMTLISGRRIEDDEPDSSPKPVVAAE